MKITQQSAADDVTLPSGMLLRYYQSGPSGSSPVILLHGSGPGATGWSNFSGNIEAIAGAGHHVIAPDMPGWGDSGAQATVDMDHDATLVELLDTLGLERVAVVGNSMGAHTAVRFATLHPDRVTHLVTMGASLGRGTTLFAPADGPSEGLRMIVKAYRDPSPENMREMVELMTFDKQRFATPELTRSRSDAALARPDHLKNYVEGLADGAPIPIRVDRDKIPLIQAPALLIHGRDDRVLHYEITLWLLASIPNSRAILINRCGHWAMIEHADEFNRLIVDFLAHH